MNGDAGAAQETIQPSSLAATGGEEEVCLVIKRDGVSIINHAPIIQ